MMGTTFVCDNGFDTYCALAAKRITEKPNFLMDVMTESDNEQENFGRLEGYLEELGMAEGDAYAFAEDFFATEKKGASEACKKLLQTIETLSVSHGKKELADAYLEDIFLNDERFYHDWGEAFSDYMQNQLGMLGLSEDEKYLVIGSKWPYTFDVTEPSLDFATDLTNAIENPCGDRLIVTHDDDDLVLKASFSYDSNPNLGTDDFFVLPSAWAKEAYASKEWHDVLSEALANEDAAEFLLEANAVPEVEKDPVSFGLLHGILTMSQNQSHQFYSDFSRCLATFDMGEFKDFCKATSFNIEKQMEKVKTSGDARALEGEVCVRVEPFFFDALYKGTPLKETPLSRGLQDALHSCTLDALNERIGGFLRGEKSAIHALEKSGKPRASVR